ncbi:MAG TPA: MBL fold metallo-hydrolase [Desulfobacterales bacterium]|nr:MBL fold metallo-hydrolase [Desulfobacterales bacterium]
MQRNAEVGLFTKPSSLRAKNRATRRHPLNEEDCRLIEIKQKIAGFDHFIGSWVNRGDINFVVDVGPANSVDSLIEALVTLNMERVDYILLTHTHIDHAGGLAGFMEHFPMARVVCHEKGIKHLVDPSVLWEGSRKALGGIAEAYGPPKAVHQERCIPHTEAHIKDLVMIETPGHAPYHLSFSYRGSLFAGEAAGNYFSIRDMDYLRPATPARFFLKDFLKSVDRLTAFEDQRICYAHFGDAPNSRHMLNRFRAQVLRWKELVEEMMSPGFDDLVMTCVENLLEEDPDLKAFKFMDPDTQARERFFLANSVKGYLGFLEHARAY